MKLFVWRHLLRSAALHREAESFSITDIAFGFISLLQKIRWYDEEFIFNVDGTDLSFNLMWTRTYVS